MNIELVREKILEAKEGRDFNHFQNFFKNKPSGIKGLIQVIADEEKYPLKEYSSWIIVHLCKSQPEQIKPFYTDFIDILFKSKDQTILRNVTNIISHIEAQKYKESELVDLLIGFIQEHSHKVALHVYAMQVLSQIVLKYPELKKEIVEVIDLNDKDKSPAYHSGRRNFLKKTRKIIIE